MVKTVFLFLLFSNLYAGNFAQKFPQIFKILAAGIQKYGEQNYKYMILQQLEKKFAAVDEDGNNIATIFTQRLFACYHAKKHVTVALDEGAVTVVMNRKKLCEEYCCCKDLEKVAKQALCHIEK